jgi:homoserine kinase type II
MAVFTPVTPEEAQLLFARLGLGAVRRMEPTTGGIENTNYFIDTDSGAWVLTLFERLTAGQLPFYLGLMHQLASRGLPVPMPRADPAGTLLHTVAGKPAAVVPRLAGRHDDNPGLDQIAQLGDVLARLHLAAADLPLRQPTLRGLAWWRETVPVVLPHLPADQAALLRDELAFIEHAAGTPAWAALPGGPIHADLFRDNALFDTGADGHPKLTGVLDFYFAGVDVWLFDLAVCLNDWCVDAPSGRIDDSRARALLDAYARVRPLTAGELRLLPTLLRAAALRFWLSRLWDWHLPRSAAVLSPKDPTQFERILRDRAASPWHPEMS